MDETEVTDRVARRLERRLRDQAYDGQDRRAAPPTTPADVLKWLPLVLACLAGVAGYVRTQAAVEANARQIERLERAAEKHVDDDDERDAEQWRRIGELMRQ